ncbi:MAG: DNA polymerase III subunit beta, partial [Alphaproteobacteria bacterium]
MKLTIERAALLKTLSHVQSVVERRNTIPILSNVRLDASDGRLDLTTTDLDLQIIETVDANVTSAGAITAPAHTMHDIVRKVPEGADVEISYGGSGDGRLTLAAGRSRFALACLPPDDFPELTADDVGHTFAVQAADLKRLIDKSRFAISTEETRYYLNGIYFHVAESNGAPVLRAVATDGHRLARVEMPAPEGSADMPGVIVPRKAVNELRKLIDEFDGAVGISLSATKIRFSFDSAVLTSKLIDGTFPDYSRVIPEGNDKRLEVDSRLFAEAVDRVSTISTDKSRPIKLALEGDRMT